MLDPRQLPKQRAIYGRNSRKSQGLAAGRPPTVTKPPASISSKKTGEVVSSFHRLNKDLAKAKANGDIDGAAELAKQIESLGGLNAYQLASIQGQAKDRGSDSSVVLVDWLKPQSASIKASASKLCMLEVGALSTKNACAKSGLFEIEHIDLHSQGEGILQQDFMARRLPTCDDERFDVISLSLVLNFVPDAAERGSMLRRTADFLDRRTKRQMPADLQDFVPALFLVLPASCIINSRYMNEERLTCMMSSLGYVLTRVKQTARLVYYLWQLRDLPTPDEQKFPKVELRPRGTRNNFAIVMK